MIQQKPTEVCIITIITQQQLQDMWLHTVSEWVSEWVSDDDDEEEDDGTHSEWGISVFIAMKTQLTNITSMTSRLNILQ